MSLPSSCRGCGRGRAAPRRATPWWRTTTRCGRGSSTAVAGVVRDAIVPVLDGPTSAADARLDLDARSAAAGGRCATAPTPPLFLAVHHLVIDGVSWRILLEDLEKAYHGEALDPVGTPFRQWAHRLAAHVESGAFDDALAPLAQPAQPAPTASGTAAQLSLCGSTSETDVALLHQVPGVYRTQVNDVLLSALAGAADGPGDALIVLEGHGREEIVDGADLSRTVGWFTTQFPVVLDFPDGDWGAVLKSVKEQLRAVPHRACATRRCATSSRAISAGQ